ncbi:predicted protein [Nematostella vectensis]|uniref:Zinc finger matrin-type protein 5 n=1 Tax=Nematostella vectensis TaxID=45351 RepID=A7RM68_NEMVE|nr:zinc finger matrin-type protein 5 [Nematostella vectensis]EDO47452.1 predicted protein [Nematostella vectensis]|eukprot:XP_001639515.1 predicted protein [Nematostella vectensis]
MGKRYYCDFCDRSFADSPQNRKKHNNGVQHQRNRKLHYDSFKDPAELLAEESSKPPCKKFFSTGTCAFGPNCRYSHTNPEMLLAAQAEKDAARQRDTGPSVEDWISRWKKRRRIREEKDKVTTEQDEMPVYTLPLGLPPVYLLPPSLRPPPPGGYAQLPGVGWG